MRGVARVGASTVAERTTRTVVRFARPFVIEGFDRELPAGSYDVETEEELLSGLSFPVYRRVSTTLHVDRIPGRPGLSEAWRIEPEALDAARLRDGQALGDIGTGDPASPSGG
jgi:hypothetical protein